MRASRTPRRGLTALLAGALAVVGLTASPAQAADEPAASVPAADTATVTSDALATVQINGVVWAQQIVGDTVYVGGQFTTARPAGAPAGTDEVPRSNLLAYDLTTGALIQDFAPVVNAQVKDLAVSPDGSTLYVGGQFTSIDGVARYRLAAFDTATRTIRSAFRPTINSTVNAVEATADGVFLGGIFTSINGTPRVGVAALNPATAATLPFTADLTGGNVLAIVAAPDSASVLLGGSFATVNGSSNPGFGLARLDATTGTVLPLPVNTPIRNGNTSSAITALASDGTSFYGVGFDYYGDGNLEGTFSARWDTGALTWVADCHGDSYGVAAPTAGGAVYSVGHAHYCGNVPTGFPQTEPWSYSRALAFTKAPSAEVNTPDIYGYPDHDGEIAPTLLNWFPDVNNGSYTGKDQGAWTVAANDDYVLLGGEFTAVNGQPQQGLVRFAVSDVAPDTDGPRIQGGSWPLVAQSTAAGEVQLTWRANWDRDDASLTYRVYRGSINSTPLLTRTVTTPFWEPDAMSFLDTGLEPGSSQRYRVTVTDSDGNATMTDWMTVTVASGTGSAYAREVLGDAPAAYWRMGEASGTALTDATGFLGATTQSGTTRNAGGALAGDLDTATTFSGTSSGYATSAAPSNAPDEFTVEAWVRTTSSRGGKIIGYGNARTGTSSSSNSDRHLYLDNSGKVWFGVSPSAAQTVTSPTAVNDGTWHHVVGSFADGALALYVDGVRVAQRTDVTWVRSYWGYWRIGGDRLAGWPNRPTSDYLAGTLDEVAVYDRALTSTEVASHWTAAGRTATVTPAPTDPYGAAVAAADPDLYWRLGEASGTKAADSSGHRATATYRNGYALGAAGAVPGLTDTAVTFNGSSGLASADTPTVNPVTYSEELWFRTTTTSGGKLIGFGNAQTGLSSSSDRHVYMETNGRLTFGVNTGTQQKVSSTSSYNDGEWHHVVATQGLEGMRLFVDGALVGQGGTRGALNITGYWRIGGDATGGPQPWFNGTLDEVAVYSYPLTAATVAAHHELGRTGQAPNQAPTASFTAATSDLAVAVDASASTDADGTVASYAWDFGDGTTGTGVTAGHTYATPGPRTVTLTVTDDDGATATTTREVTAVAPNQLPTAAFTAPVTGWTVAVDASSSSDPDGTVTSYTWTFGDGASATGVTASHAYAAPGSYDVTLTVTDDRGGSASSTSTVEVLPDATGALARDAFARTVAGGWGAADVGGPWTTTGTASRFTVDGATARHTAIAGGTLTGTLAGVSSTSTEVQVVVTADKVPTGSGAYLNVQGRRISATDAYAARVALKADGSVQLHVTRGNGSPVNGVVVPGLTFAAGDRLQVRLQVDGTSPTTVRAKVWKVGAAEPATWQASMTDSTPSLQAAGSLALATYLFGSVTNGPVVVGWDDVWAGPVGTSPAGPNQAPTAAFTATPGALSVAVDASASSDPDGTVASYAWSFGDGATATGATASHPYAAAGTYPVTLTVTDDRGATATSTQQVTVAPAPNQAPTAAFTATPGSLSVAVDGSASSDPDGTVVSYAWSFGDGATATGATASHPYAAAGTYPVTLTVTDDHGATATTTQDVTVATTADPTLARDTFARVISGGWGSAELGGAWSTTGTASRFSVDGSRAVHTAVAGGTLLGALTSVSATSTEVRVGVSADKVPDGSGAFLWVYGRRVSATDSYAARVRLQADGSVQLHVTRGNGSPVNGVVVPGLSFAAGDRLEVRLQVEGTNPTTVRARVWEAGTPEPTTWQASTTDSTASLQVPGSVALSTYLFGSVTNGPVAVAWDDLWVGPVGSAPAAG